MTHPLFDLTGRVAVVSGAASGMGRITSLGFAEVGADVVLLDINEAGAQETAYEIEKMGRRALPIYCDISDPDQIRAAFERVDSELGRVDVLSNIAGEGIRNDPLGPDRERDSAGDAESGGRPLHLHAGGCQADDGAGARQHFQHRFHCRVERARPQPHCLQHGDGRGCGDDAGIEHRVEQPRRPRQRHCMCPDYEPGLAGTDRGGPSSGGFLFARIADRPHG